MITTIEIHEALSFSQGQLFGATVITNRKHLNSGGLSKGRKVGTIVHQTLPGVLRSVADLVEQEGGDFEGLVSIMTKPHA